MGQSLANVMVHLVFSTKNRAATIHADMEAPLHRYMSGIARNLESPALSVGGMADHVHLLCVLSKNLAIAELVLKLKRESSVWAKKQGVADFYWQGGYGAFSIGASGRAQAVAYIRNQKKHHQKLSFQEEFRAILAKYRVAYDERYVWD
ncbi:MAG: transposase [Planctomycetota bacterium]|nr:transposase [Planctomycetota bacterium]